MAGMIPPGTDVWAVPAGPPPPGVQPNLINPETNENIGVVTLSVLLVVATIFVALRLYVQLTMTKNKPWWDDVLLLIALPPQVAYTGITIWMCKAGLISRHIWDTPLGVALYQLPYWTVVFAALVMPITGLVKVSLLLLYLRLFRSNDAVRWGIIAGIVVISIMYTVWMFVFIFQTVLNDTVGSHLSWAQAAFNVATDVYIFLLPISAVARVTMSLRNKIGVLLIFSTGACAIVMSCLTLYWRVAYDGDSSDATWTGTVRLSLTVIEVDIGIMVACMPLFAPLLPKRARIDRWTNRFRSAYSRLLGSQNTTQGSASHMSSDKGSEGTGVGLQEKDHSSSGPSNGHNRREWFDQTGSLTDNTVIDRNSKDLTHLTSEHQV
ncbi:hypothetical protein GQ53DRAFT_843657 [Thozetella sp. PMI_491]|nr:hypothetical protein GQ53DRAFT_843657 [Thozetella sp. PMI_491]